MKKMAYELLSCCIIACGKHDPVETTKDADECIVEDIFRNFPPAMSFKEEGNKKVVNDLRRQIIDYIKHIPAASEEEKTFYAKILVEFITYDHNITPPTKKTQTQGLSQNNVDQIEIFRPNHKSTAPTPKTIPQRISDFDNIVIGEIANGINLKLKNHNPKPLSKYKKIVLAFNIYKYYNFNYEELKNSDYKTKIENLDIDDNTIDEIIFAKVNAVLDSNM